MSLIKRTLTILMSAFIIFSAMPLTASAAQNTWNPENNVYDISTEEDLLAFKDYIKAGNSLEGVTVTLINSLDFSGKADYVAPYTDSTEFKGTFDGNEKTISNLQIVNDEFDQQPQASLFNRIGDGAVIKDLTLNNVNIKSGGCVNAGFSSLCSGDVSFDNCHITGNSYIGNTTNDSVYMSIDGGFVAYVMEGELTITNCSLSEDVVLNARNGDYGGSGDYNMGGGFCGYIDNDTTTLIENCENRAAIFSDSVGAGFVGYIMQPTNATKTCNHLTLNNCVNYGDVSYNEGTTYDNNMYAGLVGMTSSFTVTIIDRCANHGDITVGVSSPSASAGLVAEAHDCRITNSYNTGNVTSPNCQNGLGGIVGHFQSQRTYNDIDYSYSTSQSFKFPDQYNTIINCYNTGNVTGGTSDYVGSICANNQEHSSQAKHSRLENAYNFGTVTGGNTMAQAIGNTETSEFVNIFSRQGAEAIKTYTVSSNHSTTYPEQVANNDPLDFESHYGYYDSADKGGKVYPATMTPSGKNGSTGVYTEGTNTVSNTPLDTNLKDTLDKYVDDNGSVTIDGNTVTLLPWTFSDGNDGLGIHPVFGYDIINEAPESEKATNGGYITSSKDGYEYYKLKSDENKSVTLTVNSNSGKTLKTLTVTDQEGNNVALTKINDTQYSFDMPEMDVTVNAEWEGSSEPNNTVYLTTKDSVDINFIIDADYYTNDENAYVKLNYNHNPTTYATDFKDSVVQLKSVTKTEDGRYKFTIESAPAQLTETIKISLYDTKSGEPLYDVDYSMWQYCQDIVAQDISIKQNTDVSDEIKARWDKAADVCRALVDYATAAQVYFNYNTADMASKDVKKEDTYYPDDATKEFYYHNISSVTLNDLKNLDTASRPVARISGNFAVSHTSLMSLSNTEVRFYYDDEIDTEDYQLSVTPDSWYGSARPSANFGEANSGKFISVGGIEATNLDNPFTLQIKKLSTGETTTIKYNALAYCYTVLRDTEQSSNQKENELRSLLKAVFLYNRYAEDYFDSI